MKGQEVHLLAVLALLGRRGAGQLLSDEAAVGDKRKPLTIGGEAGAAVVPCPDRELPRGRRAVGRYGPQGVAIGVFGWGHRLEREYHDIAIRR